MTKANLPELGRKISNFAVTCLNNVRVFLTGGFDLKEFILSDEVHSLDLKNKKWRRVARLNIARDNHSSCTIGDLIFAICGEYNCTQLNSVEMLDYSKPAKSRAWVLIEIEAMIGRTNPAVCPVSDIEILIMGGHDGLEMLSDAWLFNIST